MERVLRTLRHLGDALPSQSEENARTQTFIHAFPFGIGGEDSAE